MRVVCIIESEDPDVILLYFPWVGTVIEVHRTSIDCKIMRKKVIEYPYRTFVPPTFSFIFIESQADDGSLGPVGAVDILGEIAERPHGHGHQHPV